MYRAFLAANTQRDIQFEPPIFGAIDEAVTITTTAAVTIALTLVGYEVGDF